MPATQHTRPSTHRPPRLRTGDAIGIVSPSWGGPAVFPHRLERGIVELERLGFEVKIGEHARNANGHVSDTARNRAQDIHRFFEDPDVRLILASIGGDHSCHLLPHLDWKLMRRHPTLLMGYSDISVLNIAVWSMTGLVTCNGPALMTDFAEYPVPLSYTLQSFLRTVSEPKPPGTIEHAEAWTEEILDWGTKADLTRPRDMTPTDGWTSLKRGVGEGTLIGGCIESLQHLRGTPYWPRMDGAILFLETSEEAPTPERVDGILMDYENMGVLRGLSGLLFGRPMNYSDEDRERLAEVLLERTKGLDFPVVTEVDFGHTSPQFVLPIGCRARLDGAAPSLEILEPAVS